MNVLRKILVGLGSIFAVALVLALASPKTVHAIVATVVQVSNTSTNPVPVVSADNPALLPFTQQNFNNCSSGSISLPSTAPNGAAVKTVVIETVSASASNYSSGTVPDFLQISPNSTGALFFVPFPLGSNYPGTIAVMAQTRLYGDPGGTVVLNVGPADSAGETCFFSVSGYLVTE